MRAYLMAAGKGTRLRPLTDITPKCLLPIGNEPLLGIWLELLKKHGVEQVLINTHHLCEQVEAFIAQLQGRGYPSVILRHEQSLLGSAGTLACAWDFVEGERDFLVCYADNLTDIDLESLVAFHRRHDALITMATFRSDNPSGCGVVEAREDGTVISFEEKPVSPKSCEANAGVYVMSAAVRSRLTMKIPADIGFDLIPACLDNLRAWPWNGVLSDIGNPLAYRRAQEIWASRPQ
jgi:mannose-1-phosphate guanylyltransferase